jgi:hypothetical protein
MKTISVIIFLGIFAACGEQPYRFYEDEDNDSGVDSESGSDFDSDSHDQDTGTDTGSNSDTGSDFDSDSGKNGDAGPDSDIDTETETSSETDTGTDSESTTGTESDDDTEFDSDTTTETDTELNLCPWDCREPSADEYDTCDTDTENPSIVQNHKFDCLDPKDICCQPLGSDEPGSIHEYCPLTCRTENQCSKTDPDFDHYCKNATLICCE